MTKEMISDLGLPVMFRYRTRLNFLFSAAIIAAICVYAVHANTKDNPEKLPPSSPSSAQPTKLPQSATKIVKPGENVFRPQETVAPGKPVSFPSDI